MKLGLLNTLTDGRGGGLNPDGLSLDLQFAADKTLTARRGPTPVFTRGSTGTFVGSNGLIQTAANNEPRFDHPSAGVCRGLLIEEGRTNLATYSEDLALAFTVERASVLSNNATSPDGATTADKLVEDTTATNSHRLTRQLNLSAIPYTFSVFAKASERSWIRMTLFDGTTSRQVWFDVSAGTIGTQSGATGQIASFGNGWWRCSITATGLAFASSQANIALATADNISAYTGDGTSGLFLWGAQLEAGSFPTSYIPTTTGSLTRSADVCSITGADFTGIYNAIEGAFLSNSSQPFITVANALVYAADNGSDSGRFNLRHQTSFTVSQLGGVTQSIIDLSDPTANAVSKIAYAYANANYGAARNGTLGAGSPNLAVPTVNRIFIGSKGHNSSEYLNGHIASLRYYKKRLPDAKLQALTV
jgi:hypothetical protein